MFDEPEDAFEGGEKRKDTHLGPGERVLEKLEELRMFAELAAVYEGPRKFDSELLTDLPADTAKDIQRAIAKLERERLPPGLLIVKPEVHAEAERLLTLPETLNLSTNDYHIARRPGEVLMVRFLTGEDESNKFYERLQAHFDVGLQGHQEDEAGETWREDADHKAYVEALSNAELILKDKYLRPLVQAGTAMLLSTQTADDTNIAFLCDQIMSCSPADLVGQASAPKSSPEGDDPEESDLSWFFKLFILRGKVKDTERMLFFTFLQKTDDSFSFDE